MSKYITDIIKALGVDIKLGDDEKGFVRDSEGQIRKLKDKYS